MTKHKNTALLNTWKQMQNTSSNKRTRTQKQYKHTWIKDSIVRFSNSRASGSVGGAILTTISDAHIPSNVGDILAPNLCYIMISFVRICYIMLY